MKRLHYQTLRFILAHYLPSHIVLFCWRDDVVDEYVVCLCCFFLYFKNCTYPLTYTLCCAYFLLSSRKTCLYFNNNCTQQFCFFFNLNFASINYNKFFREWNFDSHSFHFNNLIRFDNFHVFFPIIFFAFSHSYKNCHRKREICVCVILLWWWKLISHS